MHVFLSRTESVKDCVWNSVTAVLTINKCGLICGWFLSLFMHCTAVAEPSIRQKWQQDGWCLSWFSHTARNKELTVNEPWTQNSSQQCLDSRSHLSSVLHQSEGQDKCEQCGHSARLMRVWRAMWEAARCCVTRADQGPLGMDWDWLLCSDGSTVFLLYACLKH